jgi:oligopeptidase A
MKSLGKNPLYNLAEFPEFDKIQPGCAVSAIKAHIEDAEKAVTELESNTDLTWDGHVIKRFNATQPLWRAWGIVSHLTSVSNNEEWRKVEETLLPEIIKFSIRVSQSLPLYKSIETLRNSPHYDELDEGQQRVIDRMLLDAKNSGVALVGEGKEKFNEYINRLSVLSMNFTNNVLDATKEFSLWLRDKNDVKGLPGTLLNACAQSARDSGETDATEDKGPWRITLEQAVFGPFMQYSERADLREKLYKAHITRASSGEKDNSPLIDEILSLRNSVAGILGYENYAQLSLSSKMAGNSRAVYQMIDMVGDVAIPKSRDEMKELLKFAQSKGYKGKQLYNWDVAFWSRLHVEELYNYSPEELRPYFQFENVLDGLFKLMERLTGIKVKPADGAVQVWHKDVRFFEISDENNNKIAYLYLDPYSRPESKRGGAWMNEFQTREKTGSGDIKLPVALIVCNQAVPAGGKPSCMTPGEINPLFHEFGHVSQHILTKVDIPQASGINNVEWDAVEIASQFLENWSLRPEVLKSLSSHVDTGEKLDDEILARIFDSEKHMAATKTLRQLSFALMDMDLHSKYSADHDVTPNDIALVATKRFAVIPPLPEDRFLCSFSHIFAGGYAAGYYSYMWSDILAADVFSAFEEAGLENPGAIAYLGRRYTDTVLALGGSQKPLEVFKAFRGREPDPAALLKSKGLA